MELGLLWEIICEKCECLKSKDKEVSINNFFSSTRKVALDNNQYIDDLIDKKILEHKL